MRGEQPLASSRTIEYTVVAGDTPSSIGSLFAENPWTITQESGVSGTGSPLAVGALLRVDASGLWSNIEQGRPAANAALVEATARRLGVEPALALAVGWVESRLDEGARSPTGAIGVMQVEPDTSRLASRDLGVSIDAHRAADNILAGEFWLHSLLRSYGGDQAPALAAYYEGPGNLARRGYLAGTAEYVAHCVQVRDALLATDQGLRT